LNNVVTTQNLSKHYGRIHAVDDLSISIPERSVFGLLGPNGSGKTTTLGMLLDVVNPTAGTYSWFGNYSKKENRQKIGSILETPAFYPYLSAVSNLKIIAEIKSIPDANLDEVLKLTGLFDRRHSAYRTFSLGMKQRLALASALLCDPRVMILDEPTNGLDPRGIAEIRELIKNIAGQGKTIILASHLLDEVQKVCTHFAVLDRGKLLHTGLVNESSPEEYIVELSAEDNNRLGEILDSFPGKVKMELYQNRFIITLSDKTTIGELSKFVYEHGLILTHLVSRQRSLESQFLELVNKSK